MQVKFDDKKFMKKMNNIVDYSFGFFVKICSPPTLKESTETFLGLITTGWPYSIILALL